MYLENFVKLRIIWNYFENILINQKYVKSSGIGARLMCRASEVGKIVVNKCIERDFAINTQKLQKLLVLIQIECIKDSGFPLFSEDIRIWDCGVAIKEVDEDFRENATRFRTEQNVNIVLLASEEAYIDSILDKFGRLSADEINKLPINQQVIKLGEIKEGDTIPHVSAEKLTEVFAN